MYKTNKFTNLIAKFSKNIFLYLFILFPIFITNSCKQKENKPIVRFWHFQSEPNLKAALMPVIKRFEQKYNCIVETTELNWGDGKTKIIFSFNSATSPDVVELGSDWVAQFSSADVLLQLDSLIDIKNYISIATIPSYYNNKIYSIPMYIDTRVLYYNKDILKANNVNIDDINNLNNLVDASSNCNNNGVYGFAANGPDPHRLYKKIIMFIWSCGGDIFDKNGKVIYNSKENYKAFEIYKKLSQNGLLESQRNIDKSFIDGKSAFVLSGGWLLSKIQKENPKLNFGIKQFPGLNINNDSSKSVLGKSFTGGEYLAISKFTKEKKLAVELVKFLTLGDNCFDYYKKDVGTILPADIKYYKNEYFATKKFQLQFAEQLENSKMSPVHPKWLEIEETIEKSIEKVLLDKSTIQNALLEADLKIKKIVNQKN